MIMIRDLLGGFMYQFLYKASKLMGWSWFCLIKSSLASFFLDVLRKGRADN